MEMLAGRGFEIPFAKESDGIRTVRQTIGHLKKAGMSRDPLHDLSERRSRKVLELIKDIPKDGGSRTDLPRSRQLECHVERVVRAFACFSPIVFHHRKCSGIVIVLLFGQ